MNRLIHVLRNYFLNTCLLLTCLMACSKSEEPPHKGVTLKLLTVDPAATYQSIAGFGGANQMWGTQFPSASDMKSAFGTEESDLGLSIFRVRVPSNTAEWPLIINVIKEAKKYGAKILASPWSPPPSLKSNGNEIGGHLLEENYAAYADHLNEFIAYMASNNASVDAISIQNEPDIQVSYESCDWSTSQMRDFLKDYGHLIAGAKVVAPESFNFNQSFTNAMLNDETVVANLDIVAGHIYGSGLAPFPIAAQKGKEIWMTEYLMNLNTGQAGAPAWTTYSEEAIWNETLQMLSTVHQAIMHNWNAYIWWYLKRYYSFIGDGTNGTNSGEILKRGYAFSHFSKFIRPGYVLIKTEFQQTDALISAYKGENKTVVVLINPGTTSVTNISLKVAEVIPSSATMYVTSSSVNRSKTTLQSQNGNLVLTLTPKSITTVVIEN
jgi:glucuronoarabinoxylan endo-1,4-beta-xylanase